MKRLNTMLAITLLLFATHIAYSDATFDGLMSSAKYNEAIDYADENIPPVSRTAVIWAQLALANEKIGLKEKALASYMVAWRLDPKNYDALIGSARIYNKLEQWDQGSSMAQKALEQKFTGEASWEYARACIALKKPAEAKKALEKVIETDPSNIVANRELGIIYFTDKQYAQAVSLLKKSYSAKASADVAYKIGKSYLETKDNKNAIVYLKKAITAKKTMYKAGLYLARALFETSNFSEAGPAFSAITGKVKMKSDDYFNCAEAYEKSNKKSKAIEVYRTTIKRYPTLKNSKALSARNKVGKADLAAKKYASANKHFLFIVAKDPKHLQFSDSYLNLTDSYLGLKKNTLAISTLEKLLAFDTKNIEAYAKLADLYTKSKNSAKAKVTYEKLMKLSPNDPKVYMVLGNYNLKSKNYAKAIELFVKANGLAKSAGALEGIAISASKLKQWEKARDAAESAVLLDPKLDKARQVLADALMRSKNYAEAKDHLVMLLGKSPKDIKLLKDLATCYLSLNIMEKLASVDKKLIVLEKKNSISRFRYAEYALKKGNKDEALGVFKELSVLKPKTASVFKNLYLLYRDKKDKINSVKYLKKYVVLNPKDAQLLKELGDLQYESKKMDGALNSYRKVIALDPSIGGFYNKYAEIVIKKGLTSEVIKALNGVIKNGKGDHSTYTTLGMIYLKKKSYTKAKAMYNKALSIKPQDTDALVSLALCQKNLGNVSDAIITYQQAAMMNPKNSAAHKALGDLYTKQKKTDTAIKSYKKYLDLGNKNSALSLKVGNYCYKKGKYKEAAKYLSLVKGKEAKGFTLQLNLCKSYSKSENSANAILMVNKLLKRTPKPATKITLLNIKAAAYEKQKNSAKAVLVYDALYRLSKKQDIAYKRAVLRETSEPALAEKLFLQNTVKHPKDSRNYLKLGLIYSKNPAKSKKAISMLEKAAVKAGKDKTIWKQIAELYNKIGNEAKELSAYKRYLASAPQDITANIRIGSILVQSGKTIDGMIYLETANALSPKNVKIMLPLAMGYIATKRNQEAISILGKAKLIEPENLSIREMLLKVYINTGNHKMAMDEIQELLEKNHDNSLLRMYAKMLLSIGKTKEATDAIEDIMATDPEDIEALLILGKIQRSKKKYSEAIETYKEIAYIDAENAESLYERAETYFEMSKFPWAERFYTRALRANTKMGVAEIGLAKISLNRKDNAGYKAHIKKALLLSPTNKIVVAEAKKAGLK